MSAFRPGLAVQPAIAVASPTEWRRDIDGLRGLAVLAVLGFHFFPAWVQGGFIGVDVFFVISGYLITSILLRDLRDGSLSIASFYMRRVRRLFPALALVLASVLALGWACLYSDEYASLGAHVAGGAGFVANLQLWRESGYFDAAIESKPLAHLWSLGVEEQFYFLWPLALWWLHRRRHGWAVLAALLLASFLGGLAMLSVYRPTAFYVPVFRFWEPLTGAALALLQSQGRLRVRSPEVLAAAGGAMLVAAIALTHSAQPFPGWWALLPVVGTNLLIAAGPQATFNRVLLSNRLMVGVGLVSFPLYLWHWPLLALARVTFNAEPQPSGMAVLIGLSLVLAYLTYRLLETPVRTAGGLQTQAIVLGVVMAGIAGAGILLPRAHSRAAPPRLLASNPSFFFDANPLLVPECGLSPPAAASQVARCVRDARGVARFALVGDSKAEALFPGLVRTSTDAGRWLFIGGSLPRTSLVPVLTDSLQYRAGEHAARLALESIRRNPQVETVVIAAATRGLFGLPREDTIEDLPNTPAPPELLAGLRRFTSELLASGKKVILLVDNPTRLYWT